MSTAIAAVHDPDQHISTLSHLSGSYKPACLLKDRSGSLPLRAAFAPAVGPAAVLLGGIHCTDCSSPVVVGTIAAALAVASNFAVVALQSHAAVRVGRVPVSVFATRAAADIAGAGEDWGKERPLHQQQEVPRVAGLAAAAGCSNMQPWGRPMEFEVGEEAVAACRL